MSESPADKYESAVAGFSQLLEAIGMACAALYSGTQREADLALAALNHPTVFATEAYVSEFLERARVVAKAGDAFWLMCERLGNRQAPLDAPLDIETLHAIKKLVDLAGAWNAFNAMPALEEKYRQLSLWEDIPE